MALFGRRMQTFVRRLDLNNTKITTSHVRKINTLNRVNSVRSSPISQGLRVSRCVPGCVRSKVFQQQSRAFNIHEYQSMELMQKNGIATPKSMVATSGDEAEEVAKKMGGRDFVVKAQVLAGGRGKGTFTNGFQGGVHVASSLLETHSLAGKMIGQNLVTKQTGAEGKPCNKVLISERLYLRTEKYLAILLDRASASPVIVASPAGGMDIEAVAEATPEKIMKEPISVTDGLQEHQIAKICSFLGFDDDVTKEGASDAIRKLYALFLETDATQIEINPFAETHDSRVLCCDAKFNFDDNAEFRHPDLFALRDTSQEDPREVEAEKSGLNYIGLDGSIGCLVNGAGLAMATMDVIKLHGGEPANFLDLGGGASANQVTEAFKLLNADEKVKGILVNIFGGIMRCDVIALGLINAANQIGLKKPIVIRLAGTNVDEAKQLIVDSGLRMLTADDLGEAAEKAVRVVDIVKMAEDAHVDISFELPL